VHLPYEAYCRLAGEIDNWLAHRKPNSAPRPGTVTPVAGEQSAHLGDDGHSEEGGDALEAEERPRAANEGRKEPTRTDGRTHTHTHTHRPGGSRRRTKAKAVRKEGPAGATGAGTTAHWTRRPGEVLDDDGSSRRDGDAAIAFQNVRRPRPEIADDVLDSRTLRSRNDLFKAKYVRESYRR